MSKSKEKRLNSESPLKTSTSRFHLPKIREEFQDLHLANELNSSNGEATLLKNSSELTAGKVAPDQKQLAAGKQANQKPNGYQARMLTKQEIMFRLYQYPKLARFAENQSLTNAQQKALKDIITRKPALAASLDLYASNNNTFLYKNNLKIDRFIDEKLLNQVVKSNERIDRTEQEKIKLLKEIKRIEKEKEQLEKSKLASIQIVKACAKSQLTASQPNYMYRLLLVRLTSSRGRLPTSLHRTPIRPLATPLLLRNAVYINFCCLAGAWIPG